MARPKKDGKRANGILDSLFDINNMVPRTVKDIKSFLTMVMEDAVKEGIILYNPMRDVFINTDLAAHHSKEKIEENEFFSYEEAETFLERVSTNKL